jgi:phosphoribosylanthranilate isomerase
MKTAIKICGIKDPNMAEYSTKAGADYIGLIFHPKSPRYINDLDTAKSISHAAKEAGSIPVAVFVNQDATQMQEICEHTGIDTVQLHGENSRKNQHLLPSHYHRIYVVPVDLSGHYELSSDIEKSLDIDRDFLLFDYKTPGSGQCFNHQEFNYKGKFKFFIAGGLSEDNVAECISIIKPYALDVSSKVESERGKKDKNLINQFIARVKNAQR